MPNRPAIHRPYPPSPCNRQAESDRRRQPQQALLRTARWLRFRQWLLAERPVCEDCQAMPSEDVHHSRGLARHPEDLVDPAACQALCHGCHSRRTARGE